VISNPTRRFVFHVHGRAVEMPDDGSFVPAIGQRVHFVFREPVSGVGPPAYVEMPIKMARIKRVIVQFEVDQSVPSVAVHTTHVWFSDTGVEFSDEVDRKDPNA
jgi:hypothetical protein